MSYTCDHDAYDVHSPSHDDRCPVQMFLQSLAYDDETWNHKEGGEIVGDETSFWLEDARMTSDVASGYVIIEEMAERFANGDGDHGSKIQKTDIEGAKAVAAGGLGGSKKDGRSDVDTDRPHKGHHIVEQNWDNYRFDENSDHSSDRNPRSEEVAVVVLGLPDA